MVGQRIVAGLDVGGSAVERDATGARELHRRARAVPDHQASSGQVELSKETGAPLVSRSA
jgi:hypothetical protein